MTKTRRDIETLLRWAYRDELPKDGAMSFLRPAGFGFGWGSGLDYMANIDEVNRYGVPIDKQAQGRPHPDATLIHVVVQDLDRLEFDLPEDWYPLSDICPIDGELGQAGLGATARGLRQLYSDDGGRMRLRRSVADFVRAKAVLGAPDWEGDQPKQRHVTDSNGKPIWYIRDCVSTETGSFEIERTTPAPGKKKSAARGAYRKTYLDPDPVDAVVRRAEYQLLLSAWAALTEDLAGRLESYEPVMSDRPAWPWEDGDRPAPRILVDLRAKPFPQREPRPVAGPPPYRGIERKKESARENSP